MGKSQNNSKARKEEEKAQGRIDELYEQFLSRKKKDDDG